MTINEYNQQIKSSVITFLTTCLKQTILPEISPTGKWGNDAVNRILTLTTQGKMLRSTLLFLSHNLFSDDNHTDTLLKTAAALELIQTGLVIHDDVMDQDEERRGSDSVHIQYKKIFVAEGIDNPHKTGESFAICAGDMAYFFAFQLLSSIKPESLGQSLNSLFAKENALVCVGQMTDVYGGQTKKDFTEKEILSIYENKTARYSTILPMIAGATIAAVNGQTLKHIQRIGTALGICFQIQDDYLNLFGDPKITGKPVGSDIREGKQTLYRFLYQQKIGNFDIQNPENVIRQMKEFHILEEAETIKKEYRKTLDEELNHLPVRSDTKQLFLDLVGYIIEREK